MPNHVRTTRNGLHWNRSSAVLYQGRRLVGVWGGSLWTDSLITFVLGHKLSPTALEVLYKLEGITI